MMVTKTSLKHEDYTVGWICALPLEMAAAEAMLDEVHEGLPVQPYDHNTYILGRVGDHNTVLACLPIGQPGIASAAVVASQLLSSFCSIRFSLMVGVGGGMPTEDFDIRLGDIVVSTPTNTYGGAVQYDFGKALSGGQFQRTGMLNCPPKPLLTAMARLEAIHCAGRSQLADFVAKIEQNIPQPASIFARPTQEDRLYLTDYRHVDDHSKTCSGCDPTETVPRPSRGDDKPRIHYGLIASGNEVVKNSQLRNQLSRELGACCVEMEAAGLMNYSCLVIRGICDYADSHKNKEWQGYAAATAAAYAKELLLTVSVTQVKSTNSVTNESRSFSSPHGLAVSFRSIHQTISAHKALADGSADIDYGERQWENVLKARWSKSQCLNCGYYSHFEDDCYVKCGRCMRLWPPVKTVTENDLGRMTNHTQHDCPKLVKCDKCGGPNHMAKYCGAKHWKVSMRR